VRLPPVTPELILWLVCPPLASIAVAVGGLYVRRRAVGVALVVIGLTGVIASVLWILLVLHVEAIEHESLGQTVLAQWTQRPPT
jgi:hypothetical protein